MSVLSLGSRSPHGLGVARMRVVNVRCAAIKLATQPTAVGLEPAVAQLIPKPARCPQYVLRV